MPDIDGGRVKTDTTGRVFLKELTTDISSAIDRVLDADNEIKLPPQITVSGRNVGVGLGMFTGTTGENDFVLHFKTLVGGAGIVLTQDQSTIRIDSLGGPGPYNLFTSLVDAPDAISPNSLLVGVANPGSANTLMFTEPATTPGVVLTWTGTNFKWVPRPSGTVSSVSLTGSNGIVVSGNAITTTGSFALSLSQTGVTPGIYSHPTFSVDAQGRIGAIQSNALPPQTTVSSIGSGSSIVGGLVGSDVRLRSIVGTGLVNVNQTANTIILNVDAVRSVGLTGSNGIAVVGTEVTNTGTFAIGLTPTGAAAGTYIAPTFSVDTFGRIGAIQSNIIPPRTTVTSLGNGSTLATGVFDGELRLRTIQTSGLVNVTQTAETLIFDANAVRSVGMTGSNGIVVTGNTITDTGSFNISLAQSGAIAGEYSAAMIRVDEYGRILYVQNTTLPPAPSLDIIGNGVSIGAGVYGGSIRLRSFLGSGLVNVFADGDNIVFTANAVRSVSLAGGTGISVSGSTITDTGSFTISLANTGVSPGTYQSPIVTVDSAGRITSISERTNAFTFTALGTGGVNVSGSPVNTGGTMTVSLASSGVTPGTYSNPIISVDSYGRVTNVSSGASPILGTTVSGSGASLVSTTANGTIVFRSLSTGPGLSIVQDTDYISINVSNSFSINTTNIYDVTVIGRSFMTASTVSAQRTLLGLGTAATMNSNSFALAAHTHRISDVFSLQTELNAKLDRLSNTYVRQDGYNGAASIPTGNSSQRPSSPYSGMIRYNTQLGAFEGYSIASWITLGSNTTSNTGTASGSYLPLSGGTVNGDVTVADNSLYIEWDRLKIGELTYGYGSGVFFQIGAPRENTAIVFSTNSSDGSTFGTFGYKEKARITSRGNFLLGAQTLSTEVQQKIAYYGDNLQYGLELRPTSMSIGNTTSIVFKNPGDTIIGRINHTLSSTSYTTASDYRLKTNVEPLSDALGRVMQLPVHRFNWMENPEGPKVDGFLAHEAQSIVPEAVVGEKDAMETVQIRNENGDVIRTEERIAPQNIDMSKLVPLLTASIQELKSEIDQLKSELSELRSRLH